MGLFDFASIRRSVAGLEQQLQKMHVELGTLHRQREAVIYAPASKDDLKSMLATWIKSSGDKYRASLNTTLTQFVRVPRNMTPQRLAQIVGISSGDQSLGDVVRPCDVDQALCALFGPLLNAALIDQIDRIDWPEGSMSSDQRAAATEKLTARIDSLEKEKNDLINSAEEAGITWNRT